MSDSTNPDGYVLTQKDIQLLNATIAAVKALRQNTFIRSQEDQQGFTPEVYVAYPQTSAGIPALTGGSSSSGASPGSATCDIFQLDILDNNLIDLGTSETVYNLASTALPQTWILISRDKFGQWWVGAVPGGGSSSSSSSSGGISCDDCYDCIPVNGATVGTCSVATGGATPQYQIDFGIWDFSDVPGSSSSDESLGTEELTTFTYTGSGCTWNARNVLLCEEVAGSSSSSSTICGVYFLQLTLTTGTDGTYWKVFLHYVASSGTDWIGAGT